MPLIAPDLHLIAVQLEGLEETIISRLIDRAQFRTNRGVYREGSSGFEGAGRESLFQLRLRYQEEMDALFGRFCVPEERPFTENLPAPKRIVTLPETCLRIDDFNKVNVTADILDAYRKLVPTMCPAGDDGQYGSSTEHDVYSLQSIARRIHYGALYVGESKYRSNPQQYRQLIRHNDTEALMVCLTRREVEERILERVRAKVRHMQAEANRDIRTVVDCEVVVQFYRDCVIPLTKKGELLYLLNRKAEAR